MLSTGARLFRLDWSTLAAAWKTDETEPVELQGGRGRGGGPHSTREGRHSDRRGYFEDVEEEMLTRAIYEVKSSGFVMEAVCG